MVGIHLLGRKLWLTEKEIRCYQIARCYQRRYLIRQLLQIQVTYFINGLRTLAWSRNPLVLLIQAMIVVVAAPIVAVWYIATKLVAIVCFPCQFLRTFWLPKQLTAPGEKTLVGVHNAFARHIDMGVADYIDCLHQWVIALYGEDALVEYGLTGFLEAERRRLGLTPEDLRGSNFSPAVRSLLSIYREGLSRRLGHYGRARDRAAG